MGFGLYGVQWCAHNLLWVFCVQLYLQRSAAAACTTRLEFTHADTIDHQTKGLINNSLRDKNVTNKKKKMKGSQDKFLPSEVVKNVHRSNWENSTLRKKESKSKPGFKSMFPRLWRSTVLPPTQTRDTRVYVLCHMHTHKFLLTISCNSDIWGCSLSVSPLPFLFVCLSQISLILYAVFIFHVSTVIIVYHAQCNSVYTCMRWTLSLLW